MREEADSHELQAAAGPCAGAVVACARARVRLRARAPARFPRSPSTRSSRTARRWRWWRPRARSSGCACPAWTRRASSAPCSTATPACSASARRRDRPGGAALPPGHDGARDQLGLGVGLDHRPRRAADRAAGTTSTTARTPTAAPPPTTTPTTCCSAPSAVSTARSSSCSTASPSSTTAATRPTGSTSGDGYNEGCRAQQGRQRRAEAHHRPAPGLRGQPGDGAPPHEGGRDRLRRAVVVRARAARRTSTEAYERLGVDRPPLAALAGPRQLPRPSVAHVPAALRADAQGPDLRAQRRAAGGGHDLAARDAAGRAQLGLPLQLDPRLDVHAVGAAVARLRVGGQRLLLLHRRRRRRRGEPPGDVRPRRRAPARRAHPRAPRGLRARAARAGRQRRLRAEAARRLGRAAGLGLPAHPQPRLARRPRVADPPAPGRAGDRELARARPRHLGGPRRAQALHLVQGVLLGGVRPRRPAGRAARGLHPRAALARGRRRDQGRRPGATASTSAACSSSTTTPTRSTPRCCCCR